jgi:hypothetical protein
MFASTSQWREIEDSWVLLPSAQKGIVHFLGGAFLGTAPHISYRWLLEEIASQGYVVIATPFNQSFDHGAIARDVFYSFEDCLAYLQGRSLLKKSYLPIYGLGHSMGCKLHLLIGSLFTVERAGNILISFNNYAAKDAIPMMDQINIGNMEFTPSPLETQAIIQKSYQVPRNLLIKFSKDNLDQSLRLSDLLRLRFPQMTSVQRLNGTHLTPLSQDIPWQVGETFTPLDAIGQWFKQEFNRDLYNLKNEVLRWLNPGG